MNFDKMMNNWLDNSDNWENFEKGDEKAESSKGKLRSLLRRLAPEDEIDLHGKTISESEYILSNFILHSKKNGLRKILIIHGKGNHSQNGSILSVWVKGYLESSTLCGETGQADKCHGGSGATWVILK